MIHLSRFIFFLGFIVSLISSCSDANPVSLKEADRNEYIPIINIQTLNPISWDKKDSCQAIYVENGYRVELPASVKYRGGISSRYGKHSFSIEFSEDISIAGIEADDDWILNASYIDKTFQRHKLSYDLFRLMNPNNIAAKCNYVKVFLNGKYEGLYVAMQEVNASMIGIYKENRGAVLFKDPPIFYKEPLNIFKDSINPYQQKFPKIQENNRKSFMDDFHTFIFESFDSDFDANINNRIDLDNVIDWHLILLLSNNDDGLFKNFYSYKLDDSTPMRIAIWDYDHSYGRDGDGALNMMEREIRWKRIILLKRLMESKKLNYSERLNKRWSELRTGLYSRSNIEMMIDENTKILRPHLKENFKKWPLKSKWYEDENTYDQEIQIMKKYLSRRLMYLDDYIENLD
ncbi:MAG: CotH kinase family protein [Crocinitomicaceae bacterium]|nr:CotH kinase family protein [Crocinitomicaceae bacterium]